MPVYLFGGSVALLLAALSSGAIQLTQHYASGAIKLPQYKNSSLEDDDLEPELEGEKDPFDISVPQDWSDGDALDEQLFWSKVKMWKIAIVVLYLIIFCLEATAFGFSVGAANGTYTSLSFGLLLAFSACLCIMSGLTLEQVDVTSHWRSLTHICSLSAFMFAFTALSSLVPSDGFGSHGFPLSTTLSTLWYSTLLLNAIAMFIVATIPGGPPLHYESANIYSVKTLASTTNHDKANVCGVTDASIWSYLLFSYTTKVVMLGNTAESLEIGDLPIVPADIRAATNFTKMRKIIKYVKLRGRWKTKAGSGWETLWRLSVINKIPLLVQIGLAAVSAMLFYAPAFFLQRLVKFMEADPEDLSWGFVYCAGLFGANAVMYLITGQLWSISTTTINSRLKIQLNSTLYAKCLVRKDVAAPSSASKDSPQKTPKAETQSDTDAAKDEDDFSSKAQIMTLMTTDVDRVADFSWHIFSLVDSPIEIIIGSLFLYHLLGISSFIGLAVTCLFLPLNHWAGKVVVTVQEGLMKSRDERVALMNEVLGAIRMIKFMAWERSFEERVMKLRARELHFQRRNYVIETLFNLIWNSTPILVTLVSFWHYAIIRKIPLTPSTAFTSITIFSELKFALNALPETFIQMLQGFVSLRRIERYLISQEIPPVPPIDDTSETLIALNSATISWPQTRFSGSTPSSVASTPKKKFVLVDLNITFPAGKLSLICGRLGSGKTLLLLGLLGEADVLSGQVLAPRSPPDAIASFANISISDDKWILKGICAYVPQAAWLQNASIKENILFNLPFNEQRYRSTLEACALVSDLEILEDGDESEIGERGVNLSGGQKARVSLARAVYSRASVLLLDDVLSAVDAHTAHHLYHECLLGPLMTGRTIIVVSHHVQLCAPTASHIVALDNGKVMFQGDYEKFESSGTLSNLVQRNNKQKVAASKTETKDQVVEELDDTVREEAVSIAPSSTVGGTTSEAETKASPDKKEKKPARKLVEEEKRAVGRIGKEIWANYVQACGGSHYWLIFGGALLLAAASPVLSNGWLRIWSGSVETGGQTRTPSFYITIYFIITMIGLFLEAVRWFILYYGGLHASRILYGRLLETVLRAQIRFHDTVSRGRLLNRFGKDFEGIDSNLPDHFGRSLMYGLNVVVTVVTITYVGGVPFLLGAILIGSIYFNTAKVYGQTSRDMRRLDSVTRSPLYSIYGETISGVTIIRAFGAGSKFLRDMLRCVDTNLNPYYWMWGVNRWLSTRFNLLSSLVAGLTGVIVLVTKGVDASLAGFALTFATNVTVDILFMVRRFVGLEQAMVAVERVKEFSELITEPPEYLEPRPPTDWPSKGQVTCESLAIRYAPELPNVLHQISFDVNPGEKVGILGRTGSGKSTLALSFFRFVEATEGKILVDGLDISKIGISDLRSRLTIIPQDPTILSGTIRSTLDVFDEYNDAEIFEALRRVHLIPSEDEAEADDDTNENVFRNLESSVSEGGDNFSTGEKQLLCMARAILKRSKLLVMDEATASVDYATDELIGKTIRQEFADSTILTIAHRLRTVIDYNRVMVLEDGKVVEYDSPAELLADPSSKFYALCKATGPEEFEVLCQMAKEGGFREQ